MTPRMVSRLSRQKLTRQGLPPLISLPPPLTGSPKRQRGSSRGCPSLALRALNPSPKREQNSRFGAHNGLMTFSLPALPLATPPPPTQARGAAWHVNKLDRTLNFSATK